jgi:hypothetical protein
MKPVMTFFPETRLAKLAARFGGIARDEAVEKAKEYIESMRGEGDQAIAEIMGEIETILATAKGGKLATEQMKALLRWADQVVTLAGTFDYAALGRVMKSLCDVADGLIRAGLEDAAPIAVHVRAMRLVAPGSTALTGTQIDTVLAELAKILTHYDFTPIGQGAEEPAAAAR